MGLACSETITRALGGDIIISQSQRGLTVFAFKFPVKVIQQNLSDACKNYQTSSDILTKAGFSIDVKNYLKL
jgi:hypothetical protein